MLKRICAKCTKMLYATKFHRSRGNKVVKSILGSVCIHPDVNSCRGVIHQDHIQPLSKGGTNNPTNMQPLCAFHNTQKGANYADYRTPVQIRKINKIFRSHLVLVAKVA